MNFALVSCSEVTSSFYLPHKSPFTRLQTMLTRSCIAYLVSGVPGWRTPNA
jgi:hypothetical protein